MTSQSQFAAVAAESGIDRASGWAKVLMDSFVSKAKLIPELKNNVQDCKTKSMKLLVNFQSFIETIKAVKAVYDQKISSFSSEVTDSGYSPEKSRSNAKSLLDLIERAKHCYDEFETAGKELSDLCTVNLQDTSGEKASSDNHSTICTAVLCGMVAGCIFLAISAAIVCPLLLGAGGAAVGGGAGAGAVTAAVGGGAGAVGGGAGAVTAAVGGGAAAVGGGAGAVTTAVGAVTTAVGGGAGAVTTAVGVGGAAGVVGGAVGGALVFVGIQKYRCQGQSNTFGDIIKQLQDIHSGVAKLREITSSLMAQLDSLKRPCDNVVQKSGDQSFVCLTMNSISDQLKDVHEQANRDFSKLQN